MKHYIRMSMALLVFGGLLGTAFLSLPEPAPKKEFNKLEKRNAIALKALSKLNPGERNALISLMSDINEGASVNSKTAKKNKEEWARLKEVIAEMKNHPKFQPVKWIAADGSTFEHREDYLEYQWDVPYPSEGNPYNPFR